MAFKFKDLMIQVVNEDGDPCSCEPATRAEPAGAVPPCSCEPATRIDPAGIVCMPATAGICQPATAGVCQPATAGFAGAITMITTVTTVTTVTTLVGGAGPRTDLRTLKEQLRQILDDLERQESTGSQAAGLPASAEEADDLERRLKEAIEELQDHKKTLRKAAAKGSKK
ncbi:MAG TPA: hypothetical protein VE078_12130 [Thermoanaerobaculia bacterium]|nr:hypothetical protein [Thermoanaerobaculia bacterium]